jgi:uncharacterized protein YceK
MRKVVFSLALAVAAVSLSGCGTLNEAMFGPFGGRYYGGVQCDLQMVSQLQLIYLADLPLSAAADTVCLPLVALSQWSLQKMEREDARLEAEKKIQTDTQETGAQDTRK